MPPLGGTKLKAGFPAAIPLAASSDALPLMKHARPSDEGSAIRRSNCSARASHWCTVQPQFACTYLISQLTIQFLRFV
jgi:hypothetical protein